MINKFACEPGSTELSLRNKGDKKRALCDASSSVRLEHDVGRVGRVRHAAASCVPRALLGDTPRVLPSLGNQRLATTLQRKTKTRDCVACERRGRSSSSDSSFHAPSWVALGYALHNARTSERNVLALRWLYHAMRRGLFHNGCAARCVTLPTFFWLQRCRSRHSAHDLFRDAMHVSNANSCSLREMSDASQA